MNTNPKGYPVPETPELESGMTYVPAEDTSTSYPDTRRTAVVNYPLEVRELVQDQIHNAELADPNYATTPRRFTELKDVYVVWFCKTLQNYKALVSTTNEDTRYYEVTFNGNLGEWYIDCYIKESNVTVKVE